jgi:CBS domain-containing protein
MMGREIMKTIEKFVKKVVTTRPNVSLSSVAHLMEQHNVGAVIVVENDRPVGIVTDRDLALAVAARGIALETAASRVMSAPVITADLSDEVLDTTRTMMEARVRRLPVIDNDGRLVGLVTLDDLLRLLSRELANLIEGIKPEMETHIA